jgi:sortase B
VVVLRKIMLIVLICIFIGSGLMLAGTLLEYKQGQDLYEAAAEQVVIPPPKPEPGEAPTDEEREPVPPAIDFELLASISPDSVGWIWIPDSDISYPLVQGRDNQFYLTRTYDGGYNKLGSIFLDYRISGDFKAKNTIIYGHNMKSDAMFGTLEKFRDQAYVDARPEFTILREEGAYRYRIFSAYVTDALSDTYTYQFGNDAAYSRYLEKITNLSDITAPALEGTAPMMPDFSVPIVTLSTCTSTGRQLDRFVVHGFLISE